MSTPATPPIREGPDVDHWDAWTPGEVAGLLTGCEAAWCVVGGWAIDLFLGTTTRDHEDLEIGVPRGEHAVVRSHLSAYPAYAVCDGSVARLDLGDELVGDCHQSWLLDVARQRWKLDVMAEPGDHKTWVCRRDERLARPRADAVATTPDGVPHLRPEGVLLFKAKWCRPKDEQDFAACVPRMDADAVAWLRDALALVHPGHVWLDRLA
jgi:Aminoglycoside-2''-adenylyltransferase